MCTRGSTNGILFYECQKLQAYNQNLHIQTPHFDIQLWNVDHEVFVESVNGASVYGYQFQHMSFVVFGEDRYFLRI